MGQGRGRGPGGLPAGTDTGAHYNHTACRYCYCHIPHSQLLAHTIQPAGTATTTYLTASYWRTPTSLRVLLLPHTSQPVTGAHQPACGYCYCHIPHSQLLAHTNQPAGTATATYLTASYWRTPTSLRVLLLPHTSQPATGAHQPACGYCYCHIPCSRPRMRCRPARHTSPHPRAARETHGGAQRCAV